jgi:hypothetical protein
MGQLAVDDATDVAIARAGRNPGRTRRSGAENRPTAAMFLVVDGYQ